MNPRIPVTRKRNGSVFVEFALCATLLLLVFLGTFQFGFAFYNYNELTNAVRSGARYASMAKISNQGNGVVPTAYTTAIKNMVVYGSPSPSQSATPRVAGLLPANVSVTVDFDAKFVPQTVTVKVSSFTIDTVVKQFPITDKPSLQMAFVGQYCPISC